MTTFYDLSEEDRIALTNRAISEGRTVYERWQALSNPEAEPWSARASLAAEFLQGESSVADLGCGTMILERFLAPGTAYFPVDVVARDTRTIVCDFNAEPPPSGLASAAACLGILEYIHKPAPFLERLAQRFKTCVLSYCVYDASKPIEQRRSHAWVNDLTNSELERLFNEHRWKIVRSSPIDEIQMMWRLCSCVE